MPFRRIAAIGGLIAILLLIANVLLLEVGGSPSSGNDLGEIREYVANDESAHKAGLIFGWAVYPFLLLFLAGVVHVIQGSDRKHGEGWGLMALGASAVLLATLIAGDTLAATLILRGAEGISDSTLRGLFDAQMVTYTASGVAGAALAVAVAMPTLTHNALPRWHGVFGLVVAAVAAAGLGGTIWSADGGVALAVVGISATPVWALVTTVVLFREQSPEGAIASREPAMPAGARGGIS